MIYAASSHGRSTVASPHTRGMAVNYKYLPSLGFSPLDGVDRGLPCVG
jgi:hypothetical protein